MFKSIFDDSDTVTVSLAMITCAACGILFGVPKEYQTARFRDHEGFSCPNGHNNVYLGKTKEEKRIEELEREKAAVQRKLESEEWLRKNAETRAANEAEVRKSVERSRAAIQGNVTKMKKRIQAGVCPCCNRSFAQETALQRHLKTKHPDFIQEEKA